MRTVYRDGVSSRTHESSFDRLTVCRDSLLLCRSWYAFTLVALTRYCAYETRGPAMSVLNVFVMLLAPVSIPSDNLLISIPFFLTSLAFLTVRSRAIDANVSGRENLARDACCWLTPRLFALFYS